MGNDHPCSIDGVGSVKIRMFDGVIRTLQNVRYIPDMRKNLISLGELDARGYGLVVNEGRMSVSMGEKIVIEAVRQRKNLFVLKGSTVRGTVLATVSQDEMAKLWHMRLGHMSEKGLTILHKRDLLPGLRSCALAFCEHCVFGKHKRSGFGVGTHNSKEILVYVHFDVWGKSPTPSHSGKEYYVSFVDDYSRYVWVYFMREKSDVFEVFKKWKVQVET